MIFDAKLRFALLASLRSANQKTVCRIKCGAVQFCRAIFNLFVNRERKCPNKSNWIRKHWQIRNRVLAQISWSLRFNISANPSFSSSLLLIDYQSKKKIGKFEKSRASLKSLASKYLKRQIQSVSLTTKLVAPFNALNFGLESRQNFRCRFTFFLFAAHLTLRKKRGWAKRR